MNKVFFTERGLLKFIEITPELDISAEVIIHDFNGYAFEPVEAPYNC